MSDSQNSVPPSGRRRPILAGGLLLAVLAIGGVRAAWPEPERPTRRRSPPVATREFPPPAAARRAEVAAAPAEERETPCADPEVPAPLAPDPGERADPATFTVGRIVHDPADPDASFAIVGGRAYREGDRLGGWPVFRVLPTELRLGEKGEIRIPVSGEEIE